MRDAATVWKRSATDDMVPAIAEPRRPKQATKPVKKATMVKNSESR